MKPLPHRYAVALSGGPGGHATLTSPGLPTLATATPVEFDGPGDAWSPEHLFLGAVVTCFVFTFRAVARVSQLSWQSIDVQCDGDVERADHVTRFSHVVLRPTLVISATMDPVRAASILARAERQCLVTASLATEVRLEPRVEVAEPATTPP